MATPLVTGVVGVWVGVPVTTSQTQTVAGVPPPGQSSAPPTQLTTQTTNITPVFLGTGEKAPRIVFRRSYSPLHNDISGPIVPYDRVDAGKEAFISLVLTRWNEPVLQAIQSTPFPGRFPGKNQQGDRGTLIMTEGAGYPLYLRYGNNPLRPGMVNAGLVPGRRFLCAILDGEEVEEPGTDVGKRHIMFYCQSVYASGTLALYDYNMAGTTPIPPN
jgi:hypothetical protein